jgi:hypothetical protein
MAQRNSTRIALVLGFAGVAVLTAVRLLSSQRYTDPQYQIRKSNFDYNPPAGTPVMAEQSDTGLRDAGDFAERKLNYSFDAGAYTSGNIWLGAEYGRVEILPSSDQQARLQIHLEAKARDAARALKDTQVVTSFSADGRQINIAAWHTTQGYTLAQQPAWMRIRLEVPGAAHYTVTATTYHGGVSIQRLTLKNCKLEGSVGLKVRRRSSSICCSDALAI